MATEREKELRRLLKECRPELRKRLEKLARELEDEDIEIQVEILYDN